MALELVHPLFLADEVEFGADVQPAGGHVEFWDDGADAIERSVDGGRRFDIVLDAFERHPRARKAAHGVAQKAEIDDLLHARRVQDGDHRVHEVELGLVRVGGGFGGVIVAVQGQDTPMGRGARKIGVAEHVARAVHARPLAVPQAEHAIDGVLPVKPDLLRAPHGGGGQFLVEPRLEAHIGSGQLPARAVELLVEPSQGGAAIARYETRCVQPRPAVEFALHQEHPHHGLNAGREDRGARQVELVGERHLGQGRVRQGGFHGSIRKHGVRHGEGPPRPLDPW